MVDAKHCRTAEDSQLLADSGEGAHKLALCFSLLNHTFIYARYREGCWKWGIWQAWYSRTAMELTADYWQLFLGSDTLNIHAILTNLWQDTCCGIYFLDIQHCTWPIGQGYSWIAEPFDKYNTNVQVSFEKKGRVKKQKNQPAVPPAVPPIIMTSHREKITEITIKEIFHPADTTINAGTML